MLTLSFYLCVKFDGDLTVMQVNKTQQHTIF